MGLMAFLPVLALYVHERFGIENGPELAFWTGLIYGAAPLAAAIAGPFWGALGDRVGKKPMAVRANLAIALSTAAMPFAPTPLVLLLMRAVQGAFAGYVAPAIALAAQAEPRARHGVVIARLQVAMAAGSFVGPYLGAELTHWFGRDALFWAASALSGLAALQLHVFAHEEQPAAGGAGHGPFVRGFLRAAASLLRAPVLGWLFALLLLLRLGQNMLEPLLALQIRELGPLPWIASWNPSPALALDRTVAAAFAVLAVAQWVCTPWWGRQADRHGPLRCLGLLSLGLAAAFAATAFVATISQFLLLRVVVACLMAGSMTLAYAVVSKRVADEHRTLAFAMVQSCIQFGLSLGPLLAAWVAAEQGPAIAFDRAFFVAAALCGAAGLGMLLLRALTLATTPASEASALDEAAS